MLPADPSFRWHFTATFADVRRKARRLKDDGRVRVINLSDSSGSANVQGDHGTYVTSVYAGPGQPDSVAMWECGCAWSQYSWGRSGQWKRFEGRMCSHALALHYEIQARRRANERQFAEDTTPAHWEDPRYPARLPQNYPKYDRVPDPPYQRAAARVAPYHEDGPEHDHDNNPLTERASMHDPQLHQDLDAAIKAYNASYNEDDGERAGHLYHNHLLYHRRKRAYEWRGPGDNGFRVPWDHKVADIAPAEQYALDCKTAGKTLTQTLLILARLGLNDDAGQRCAKLAYRDWQAKVNGVIRRIVEVVNGLITLDDGEQVRAHQVLYPTWHPTLGLGFRPTATKVAPYGEGGPSHDHNDRADEWSRYTPAEGGSTHDPKLHDDLREADTHFKQLMQRYYHGPDAAEQRGKNPRFEHEVADVTNRVAIIDHNHNLFHTPVDERRAEWRGPGELGLMPDWDHTATRVAPYHEHGPSHRHPELPPSLADDTSTHDPKLHDDLEQVMQRVEKLHAAGDHGSAYREALYAGTIHYHNHRLYHILPESRAWEWRSPDDGGFGYDRKEWDHKTAEVRVPELADGDDRADGVMVHLVPPDAMLDHLAQDDGDHPTQLHITLAYLGLVEELGDAAGFVETVKRFAATHPPLAGSVSGPGLFASDEAHTTVALWDIPGLPEWRQELVEALKAAGYAPSEDHGYSPHTTLSIDTTRPYEVLDLSSVEGKQARFAKIWIGIGPRWESFDLAGTKTAADEHWRPTTRIFSPTKPGLDPALFEADRHLKDDVRQTIVGMVGAFWASRYGADWPQWARIYLAGSEASYWWANQDLDLLIGVDYERMRVHVPLVAGKTDAEITASFNREFFREFNDGAWRPPWGTQEGREPLWRVTAYVNPNSWDIRAIKPYAAYNVSDNVWSVLPPTTTDDWGPTSFPAWMWQRAEAMVAMIRSVDQMPEGRAKHREGAQLYDFMHLDRSEAFSPEGQGVFDQGNVVEKYLADHPEGLLAKLRSWKDAWNADQKTAQGAKEPLGPGSPALAWLMQGPPAQGAVDMDIATAARAHLQKTAGMATFSPAEQRALIEEGEGVMASNLDGLDLTGTHYELLDEDLLT